MEATTPNSVAPTMLRVVDSVVLQWCANGCNNMQQGVQRDITCTNIQQCSVCLQLDSGSVRGLIGRKYHVRSDVSRSLVS